MREIVKKAAEERVSTPVKSVILFLGNAHATVHGDWDWDLQTDTIYASSVMSFSDAIEGTRSLIHPDDLHNVRSAIGLLQEGERLDLDFRIITTYGEIRQLSGTDLALTQVEIPLPETPVSLEASLQAFAGQRELRALQVRSDLSDVAESLQRSGSWYINKATGETWYSANLFRLYGLAPHSLNVHPHTFHAFIHPEDRAIVLETLESAFDREIPLRLQHRIIHASESVRQVRLHTYWSFNRAGHPILYGTLADITGEAEQDKAAAELADDNKLLSEVLGFAQAEAHACYWITNLATHKTTYSAHSYRIMGVRPPYLPIRNSFLSLVHPDDRERIITLVDAMYREHVLPEAHYRIVRPDGKVRNIRQTGKLVIHGGQLMMVGCMQDLSVREALLARSRELEAAVQQREAILALLETGGEAGVITWHPEGKIDWSPGVFKMLGYRPGSVEPVQKLLYKNIFPGDLQHVTDAVLLAWEGQAVEAVRFRINNRGQLRRVVLAFRAPAGMPNAGTVVGVLRDETELTETRQQKEALERMSQLVAETVSDLFLVSDAENMVIGWNGAAEKKTGIRGETAIHSNLFDLFPALASSEYMAALQAALAGKEAEVHQPASGYLQKPHQFTLRPLLAADGSVEAVLHVVQDISKEQDLQQQLTERLLFIEKLVEASVDRIVVLDRNMNYLYWNARAEEYYALEKSRVLGRNILEIFPGFRSDPSYQEFRKVLRGETVHLPARQEEEGNYFETYLIPIKEKSGGVSAILWLTHDLRKDLLISQQQQKEMQVLSLLNECYYELDDQLCFRFLNPRGEAFFNRRSDALKGQVLWEALPQYLGSPLGEAILGVVESGRSVSGEFVAPVTGRWIYASIARWASGVAVMFFDIQNIKEAEQELREYKQLTEQILAATPDFVMVFSLENNTLEFVSRSPYKEDETRYREPLGIPYDRLMALAHPDDRANLDRFIQGFRQATDDEVHTCEYRVVKEAEVIWYRSRGKVFKRDAEGVVTHYISVVSDFTEEMELRRHLQERILFSETLVEASIDRIMVLDPGYKLLAWNRRCEEVYGLEREDVLGRSFFELFPRVQSDDLVIGALRKTFAGEPVYIPERKELHAGYFSELYYQPIFNAEGEVEAVLHILHDISAIHQVKEELRTVNTELERKNRELEEKNEELTSFAFVASHDLKEPLRKILTFSDWLLQKGAAQLHESGINYLRKIGTSVQQMNHLIEDILVLAKIERHALPESVVNLNSLVQTVLHEMQDRIRNTGTELEVGELPTINGYDNLLGYLFRNLLDNAMKFQPPGNRPSIAIRATEVCASAIQGRDLPEQTYCRIDVEDNGLGFDRRYAHKIFQVFQRLHARHEYEGTGLGLALCKKIMQHHRGFIEAESTGSGAVFSCYFPVGGNS